MLRVDHLEIRWQDDWPAESCVAVAEINYLLNDEGTQRLEWLSSGGLYDIDAPDAAYRVEVETDQLSDLRDHIAHFGLFFTDREWSQLVDGATGRAL